MSYRDDRPALRDRAELLEQELDRARAEIERLRAKDSVLVAGRAGPPRAKLTLPMLVVLLPLVVLFLPVPVVLKLTIATLCLSAFFVIAMLASLLVLSRPAEAVVLSGGAQGHRAVVSGRALRVPMVEQAAYLDLGIFRIPLSITGANTASGRAYQLEVVAHARLSPREPGLSRAIERFVGVEPERRARSITQVLEPVLRRVVQSVDDDTLASEAAQVADAARREAANELDDLGVELVSLFMLSVRSEAR